MSLEDAIGSGPDFTADSVLDRISRSVLPDLPENVSGDAVLNRLNRKLSLIKPAEEEKSEKPPEKSGKLDLSSEGTPVGDLPDLSQYGTPADAVPLPQPRPAGAPQPPLGVTGQLGAAGKQAGRSALGSVGGLVQGLGTPAPPMSPAVQTAAAGVDPANQWALPGTPSDPEIVPPAAPPNAAQRGLIEAGQGISQFGKSHIPMTKQEEESGGAAVGGVIGSVLPYTIGALIPGAEGLTILGGVAGMGLTSAGQTYQAAKDKGASDADAAEAAGLSGVVGGALGALPLGAIMRPITQKAPGLAGWAAAKLAQAAQSGVTFATVGEAQEYLGEQIAKKYYDEDAGYAKNFTIKRVIAELVGGSILGMFHPLHKGEAPPDQPAAEAPQPAAQARAPQDEGLPPPGEEQPASAQSTGTPPPGPDTGASGAGAQPGPGPDTGGPGAADSGTFKQSNTPPPEPEPEPARGAKTEDFTMDPKTRAKMERVFRTFEPGTDPSKMSDADLFNALQEHLRDTSSTGYSAKPETAEEAAARKETAARRAENEILRKAGWSDAHINAMTPEQRKKYSQPQAAEEKPSAKGAPEQPTSTSEAATFTTSKGSAYQVHEDGTTTRNKAARSDVGHEGDSGPKERSAKTVYFDKDAMSGMAPPQDTRWRVIDHGDGTMSLATWNDARKDWGISPGSRNVPYSDKPAVGLHPLEVWKPETIKGFTAYKGMHPGNAITEIKRKSGTREAPIRPATADDVVRAQASEPTPAQAIADNYKQAHVELPHLGLSGKNGVTIETGVGGTRKSKETGPDGKPTWETTMEHAAYGKIRGTKGADGDHLDVFVGPHPQSPHVFVLDQLKPDGSFDEHKILAGYRTPLDAMHGYVNSYNDLAKGRLGGMTAFTPDEFKDWLRNGDHTKALMSGQKLEVGTAGTSAAVPKEPPAERGAQPAEAAPKTPKPANGSTEPLSLLQFVASKGGIKPHPELEAIGLNGKHRVQLPGRKGFFGVVRPGGEDLDRMREAAEEAGYFRGEHNKTSTVRDILDAFDNELRGQRVSAEGEEHAQPKREKELAAERERHDQERDEADYGEARRNIADAGYTDLPSDLYNAAAKLVANEGMDPDSAVERAAERLVAEDSVYRVTADNFDTTYEKGAFDAAQTRAAPSDGEPASRPRAERARPGEGEEDRANGERVPAAGAESGQDQDTIATNRDAIEKVLGPDADRVSQVDIASAAEMMADHPDMDVAAAFGRAVVQNAVRQKFLTALEAAKAYGKEVETVLEPGREGASGSRVHPEPGRAEPVKERTRDTGKTRELPGSGEAGKPAVAAEVQNEPVTDTTGKDTNAERNASGEAAPAEVEREAPEGTTAEPEEPSAVKIRSAGVRYGGKIYEGTLHSDAYQAAADATGKSFGDVIGKTKPQDVGFVTNSGRFVSRDEAARIVGYTGKSELAAEHFNDGELKAPVTAAKPEEPKPTVEKGAEGKPQLVIPGAEKAGQGDLAQRAANAPLKPKVAQKGMEVGLFGDEKDQTSLFEPDQKFGRGAEGQAYTLAQGRKTGNEHLIAYDAKGDEIARIEGIAGFVKVTPELNELMHDPSQDIVIHHNHPNSMSLSPQDVAMMVLPGLHSVWAHGHNGNIYRGELTEPFKASLPSDPNQAYERIIDYIDRFEKQIKGFIRGALIMRHVTLEEANRAFTHLSNVILRDAGLLDYQTNFDPGDFINKVPGLDKAIRASADRAHKEAFRDTTEYRPDDRRARPVRHPGDVGAVFDRAEVAAPVNIEERIPPARPADREREVPRREDKGVGGTQPRLLENEAGFAQPDNTFKKEKSFDTSIGDILRKRLLGRLSDLNLTEARVQLQDKFLRVKKAEEAKANTNSDLSAYQAESLYYGRTGHRLEQLRDNHIDPIIREMKGRDIDLEQMDKFLYARHAVERNRKVGAMYPPGHPFHDAMNDPNVVGGSGMSKKQAQDILNGVGTNRLVDYKAVAAMIDALNYKTRRTLLDSGLIDRATFDSMNSTYKWYVPLRGWAEGSEDEASLGSQGSGHDIRGDETKQAFGRKSLAASPLAYTLMQAELAIVRAEKNKVGNTFLRFVRSNPDPAMWMIDRPDQRKSVSKVTGLVTSIDNGLSYQADNVFATKVDGKTVHITLKGPDGLNVARGLKNMGTAQVHAAIRMIASVTHAMAKLATSWNPNFMIPNLVRDLGEAFINLQAQQQKKFVRAFAGHIIPAIRGSMLAIAGKQPIPGTKTAKYIEAFHRYDREGGRIHFFGIEDPDKIEGNVNAKLKRLDGGIINGVKDLGEKAGKAFEIMGGGIENATRLAAFMAAEDAGLSTPDAAMLARNLTVDFNKKGELGSVISSLYMFSNAGAQGVARALRALGHKRVWAMLGALAAASAMAALYDIGAGGEDEAGTPTYMKIPPWERDKNIIIMLRNGSYAKIPTPYGFAPFGVAGAHSVAVLMGKEKPGAAAMAIVNSIVSAFNPLGEEDSWAMSLVPSALRPAFHIAFNKDWTGKPLYPDGEHAKGMPASGQSFRTNSTFSKEAAKDLNKATGGNDYAPGLIDVHPGAIDHMMSAITGGIGKFVKDIADTIMTGATDHEWQPEKTPILRRFVGKVGADADRFAYYEAREAEKKLEGPVAAAKKDRKAGINEEEADKFLEENQTPQKRIFERADNRMKQLRKDEAEATNSTVPYDEKKARLDAIRQEMRDVQNHARAESAKLKELVH